MGTKSKADIVEEMANIILANFHQGNSPYTSGNDCYDIMTRHLQDWEKVARTLAAELAEIGVIGGKSDPEKYIARAIEKVREG